MSKRLDKRARLEKRKRQEAEKRLAIIRKGEVLEAQRLIRSLPLRERNLLTGSNQRASLDADNLQGMTHKTRAYVGRSPGTMPAKRKPMPDRFLTAFMAPGHEKNATEKASALSMVKVAKRINGKPVWRIVGKADTKPLAG